MRFETTTTPLPISDWLADLEAKEPKAYQKCLARILELSERGSEMRRPHADYLRDGVYELRATHRGNIHYRILYFFYEKNVVALSHGTTKKAEVPPKEIDRAIRNMALVMSAPMRYTADFEID